MKPNCKKCNKIIPGAVKLHTYRKKLGNKTKNIVEHYCEKCFITIEEERAWALHRRKQQIFKAQIVRRMRRKQKIRR